MTTSTAVVVGGAVVQYVYLTKATGLSWQRLDVTAVNGGRVPWDQENYNGNTQRHLNDFTQYRAMSNSPVTNVDIFQLCG